MIKTISSTGNICSDRSVINIATSNHNIDSTCNESCSVIIVTSDIANEIVSIVAKSNSTITC